VRLATCHRSRKGEGAAGKKRKEVEASVPARKRESDGLVARMSKLQVAEFGRRRLVPNTLGKRALKKGGQGRVNGGLARSEHRRMKPSVSASSEGTSNGRAHRTKTGVNRPRPTVT